MSDDTYNGWKNYPTWAVNLWLTNDEGSYNWLLEITRDEYDDAADYLQVREGIWKVEEARKFNLANRLREEIEELQPTNSEASMYQDLLGWALEQIDWHEIAESSLLAYAEGLEYA